ncbi:MAG: YbaB/EbfC family nucleoid-associated protein [Actinobacteria bacterium]|nr:MAG: YbaB/EbfC family nucleoid-associated protein [Actinomycetota bacterium]
MRPEWQAHIDELLGQYRTMRDRLGDTQRQIAQLQATAESPDGLVEVTVGPRGELVSLKLRPGIYRAPDSDRLAELILATTRDAARLAHERLRALIEPIVPAELGDLGGMGADFDVTALLPEDPTDLSHLPLRPR